MALRRKASLLTRQLGLAALGATVLLTVIRFSGTLAVAYGQERAQLQGMVLLAVTLCWTFQALTGLRAGRQSRVRALAAGCLAVVLVNTVYLVGAVLAARPRSTCPTAAPRSSTSTSPRRKSRPPGGCSTSSSPGHLVYADEYGQVPLAATAEISSGLMTT